MKNIRLIFVVLVLLVVSSVDVYAAAASYAEVREEFLALLSSPQAQRQRHNWEKVARRIEDFIAETRDAGHKDDAAFLLGRTWHGLSRASGSKSDAQKALEVYTGMARDYAVSNLADDALIAAAEISLESFSDQGAANNYYLQITTVLPPGDMLPLAQSRLKQLASTFSDLPKTAQPTPKATAAGVGTLSAIRVWNSPEYTRVVLDLSQLVAYEPHQLTGSDPRIYLDLSGVALASTVSDSQAVNDGILRQIRSSSMAGNRARIVLDLQQEAEFQVFSLENPNRVVIDVRRVRPADDNTDEISPTLAETPDSIAGILEDVPTSVPPTLHVPQHNARQGIQLIVVDAGHGGKDPGAVGRNDTFEKDVTLAVALKLSAALRNELKCKVLLTRSDDRYIPLRSRTDYANKVGADLFISLHANASINRKAYGLETYYLNLSKNNQAAQVAARENGTSLEEVGNLEAILFDLMANAKINESSRLAAEIQQSLVQQLSPKFSHIKDLGVRQGPFHVLLGATMPSVLVETAFISNGREEKRLNSNAYQERVADAIVKGIKDYSETLSQVARQ